MNLEGDGMVENLYHYIWSKDSLFKTSPDVLIPDTIVYRFEQPAFWYFSTVKKDSLGKPVKDEDGHPVIQVLRKNKNSLNNAAIRKKFLKGSSESGIVAVYIYNKTERNIVNVMNREMK